MINNKNLVLTHLDFSLIKITLFMLSIFSIIRVLFLIVEVVSKKITNIVIDDKFNFEH